ncbi:hypothetical protein FGU65_11270 [Methanoculleus sp. FWC-SCC1]|uniref:Uncharacterized protein n=1 Tax=Methanoculleus frigidifontis TaxID=2584085 RepID=A0ABT8MBZ5_9EURY|nr:hypothetical protein [Methanoculleus sp. FWC-SCC1]MDN7025464.1 hypothetical protein [Methanoculleus sp. FWC-SCC1]
MKQIQRDGLLFELIDELTKYGSWCGETHIQKAAYFLEEMLGVSLGLPYILYKHGPFSFDLSDELASMRADALLAWEIRPGPYGNTLKTTRESERLKANVPRTLERYRPAITFVARKFGQKGVKDLEKISTALYVTKTMQGEGCDARARQIVGLKPHISFDEAKEAVRFVDEMMAEAEPVIRSVAGETV